MSVNPLAGFREKMVSQKGEQGNVYSFVRDEPGRGFRVTATMRVTEVAFRPSTSDRFDLNAEIWTVETPAENPAEPNSGNPVVTLRIQIASKEVALITGLAGRQIHFSGEVPEKHVLYDQHLNSHLELQERYENLIFQLEEARASLGKPVEVYRH